ncbi:MAG: hypothetical protein ACYC3I_16995 [Gemmataceae bacterium]
MTVELLDAGRLVFADTIDPMQAAAVAKLVGVVRGRGYHLENEQVLDLRQGGELELAPLSAALAESLQHKNVQIVRRRRHQPASAGTVFSSIDEALADGADDDELSWDDIERLAILDVDYHDLPLEKRPQSFQLEALALIIRPRPKRFWISRGRGLHLLYVPAHGLTAEEAAACGGLSMKQLDPKCTFEIIARTSYPPGGKFWP